MIRPDISENQVNKKAYLAIGSNLGNKKLNIESAKSLLQKYGINILKCSSNYESTSWPDPKKPKFINIVIEIKTNFSAYKLLNICNKIEIILGRKRYNKNEPRTCDIDIIDYNHVVLKSNNFKKLILPHPKLSNRSFVLLPLFEISKTWIHPKTKINIVKLMNSLNIQDLRSIKQI